MDTHFLLLGYPLPFPVSFAVYPDLSSAKVLPLHSGISLYDYSVCVCRMHFSMGVCTHMCAWRSEGRNLLQLLTTSFLKMLSPSLHLELTDWLDFLAVEPRDPPTSAVLSSAGITGVPHHAPLFMWLLGSALRSSCLHTCTSIS